MDKMVFLNTFLAEQAVKDWLGGGSENCIDRLVDKLLEVLKSNLIKKSNVYETPRSSSSNTKKVEVTFGWGREKCHILCFDNSFKADFRRIAQNRSKSNNTKLPLFCKCFAISATSSENKDKIVDCLKSAMKKGLVPCKKTENLLTEDDISKALLYLYSGRDVPAASYRIGKHSTSDTEEDVIKTFCNKLFYKKSYENWRFKKEFKKAYSGIKGSECRPRFAVMAKNIVEKAKMHPVFELMFNDKEGITTYEDEIVTLLDTSTIYNPVSKSDKSSDLFEGITVLSPYASFYNMLVKQQADAFFKLPPSLNQYHLTVLLGEFAQSAMKSKHEFKASSIEKNGNFKKKTFQGIYNDTFEKKEVIEKYVFEKKLKWFICKGNKWRFSTAQHRLFFLASYDCLKYFLGVLNEGDLVELLLDKLLLDESPNESVGNHLDRKFLTFLCYSYFLFSILSAKSVCLINKLIKCANDYSVENRNTQMAVLMLFSMLLSENYPASPEVYTKLIDNSYGRAVYDYQLLVLETIKRKNASHINYMKKQVYKSLKLDGNNRSEVDPYFLLVASKIGIDQAPPADSSDKKAEEVPVRLLECVKLHGQTWPEKNIPNNYTNLVGDIVKKLKEFGTLLKPKDNPSPADVFGANLLFYSLANVQRVKSNTHTPLFDSSYDQIYRVLIYTDYHTRRLSKGYNKESPSDFYLLCGPYRFVCSVRRTDNVKSVQLDGTMMDNYKTWYENEKKMSQNGSMRYFLLMTRLLSYTDFFKKANVKKPSKEDWENTEFLKYDNVPAISDDFINSPHKLS